MDENGEAAPYPRNGQQVRVVDGPFADFLGTVVDVDELQRQVEVVVLFFGHETAIRIDVLNLEAIP